MLGFRFSMNIVGWCFLSPPLGSEDPGATHVVGCDHSLGLVPADNIAKLEKIRFGPGSRLYYHQESWPFGGLFSDSAYTPPKDQWFSTRTGGNSFVIAKLLQRKQWHTTSLYCSWLSRFIWCSSFLHVGPTQDWILQHASGSKGLLSISAALEGPHVVLHKYGIQRCVQHVWLLRPEACDEGYRSGHSLRFQNPATATWLLLSVLRFV